MTKGLSVWGFGVAMIGDRADAIVEEIDVTFNGAVGPLGTDADISLTLSFVDGPAAPKTIAEDRVRHRGGSAACKYFLDGTRFDATEQTRDIAIVKEFAAAAVYATQGTWLVADSNSAIIVGADLPPMLASDIVENHLLSNARKSCWVQVHCSGWIENDRARLLVGSSGIGKTTELFRQVSNGAARFLSNDRGFLRLSGEGIEVRGFPLPVNIGCGTIRSLGLDIPDLGLEDDDKIRLTPSEVAERFGADYERWYPVEAIACRDIEDLLANCYWDEDPSHPFWNATTGVGPFPKDLRSTMEILMHQLVLEGQQAVLRPQ